MKQIEIVVSTEGRFPMAAVVYETFKVPFRGIVREVNIRGVYADGVAYTEDYNHPRTGKVCKKKHFHSKAHFLSKMWNHRMPANY